MLDTVIVDAQKVISLTQKRLQKTPPLKEILSQNPELRGFIRFIARNDLREKALKLVCAKLGN